MNLKVLSEYKKITIQCHNNPDADAIASAFAMYGYFKAKNIPVRIIYCGKEISKPNLKMMIGKLQIPIEHIEDADERVDGLLLLVDCQYGESNVTKLKADAVAVMDHHSSKGDISEVDYSEIMPHLGSCSTLVWNLLRKEGYFDDRNSVVETALYYGLMTDTENFVEAHHPLDLDMRDEIIYDKMAISQFCNSNISLDELEVAGIALLKNIYNSKHRFSVAQAKECDPNVMGMIIDLVKTVDAIDTCVIFNDCGSGYKFSVRSCVPGVHANELAEYIAVGIGSAGGHVDKAGGYCDKEAFIKLENSLEFESYLNKKMADYFDSVEIVKADEYELDLSACRKYMKKSIVLGYVDPSDFMQKDVKVLIRTSEGDVNTTVDGTFYIMIGVLGEVYPIRKDKFDSKYKKVEGDYECSFTYEPIMRTNDDGKKWELKDYAKSCLVTEKGTIYARKLKGYAKVYTDWYKDNYMYGKPGDYLCAREDDLHDLYIIREDIFEKTYELFE